MKIEIEVADDKLALMQGVAGWFEMTLAQWIDTRLGRMLACEVEGAAQDLQRMGEKAGIGMVRIVTEPRERPRGSPRGTARWASS